MNAPQTQSELHSWPVSIQKPYAKTWPLSKFSIHVTLDVLKAVSKLFDDSILAIFAKMVNQTKEKDFETASSKKLNSYQLRT